MLFIVPQMALNFSPLPHLSSLAPPFLSPPHMILLYSTLCSSTTLLFSFSRMIYLFHLVPYSIPNLSDYMGWSFITIDLTANIYIYANTYLCLSGSSIPHLE